MKGMFHNDRQVITAWYKFNSNLFHDVGSLQSLDWTGGLDWWTGSVD